MIGWKEKTSFAFADFYRKFELKARIKINHQLDRKKVFSHSLKGKGLSCPTRTLPCTHIHAQTHTISHPLNHCLSLFLSHIFLLSLSLSSLLTNSLSLSLSLNLPFSRTFTQTWLKCKKSVPWIPRQRKRGFGKFKREKNFSHLFHKFCKKKFFILQKKTQLDKSFYNLLLSLESNCFSKEF